MILHHTFDIDILEHPFKIVKLGCNEIAKETRLQE